MFAVLFNITVDQTIDDLVEHQRNESTLDTDLHCQTRRALLEALPSLNLDCDMVGTWKDDNPLLCTDFVVCNAPPASPLPIEADLLAGVNDAVLFDCNEPEKEKVLFCTTGEESVGGVCK